MQNFQRLRAGQPWRVTEPTANAIIAAAEQYSQRSRDPGSAAPPEYAFQGNIVQVKNTSDAAMPRFSVAGLGGGALFGPDANLAEFQNFVRFNVAVPTADDAGAFCVLIEPIAAGAIGLALVSGVAPVQIYLSDATPFEFADVSAGNLYLQPAASGARVLWCEAYSDSDEDDDEPGPVWAYVRIPESGPGYWQPVEGTDLDICYQTPDGGTSGNVIIGADEDDKTGCTIQTVTLSVGFFGVYDEAMTPLLSGLGTLNVVDTIAVYAVATGTVPGILLNAADSDYLSLPSISSPAESLVLIIGGVWIVDNGNYEGAAIVFNDPTLNYASLIVQDTTDFNLHYYASSTNLSVNGGGQHYFYGPIVVTPGPGSSTWNTLDNLQVDGTQSNTAADAVGIVCSQYLTYNGSTRLVGQTGTDGVNTFTGGIVTTIGTNPASQWVYALEGSSPAIPNLYFGTVAYDQQVNVTIGLPNWAPSGPSAGSLYIYGPITMSSSFPLNAGITIDGYAGVGSAGVPVVLTLAKLTTLGANGSITIMSGIVTAYIAPT